MPYSHYHNGSYHTHRRRRKYGRHYWVGRRRWQSWSTPILFILLAAVAVGGIVYFVRPSVIGNVAQEVAQNAERLNEEREAEKARKLDLRERKIATLTNVEREQVGIPPLLWDSELRGIARSHSSDMAENNYFAHRNELGDRATERGVRAGYQCSKGTSFGLGENLEFATGQLTPEETVQGWMDSPGHRKNMLSRSYDRIGIGVHDGLGSGQGYYTTMLLC